MHDDYKSTSFYEKSSITQTHSRGVREVKIQDQHIKQRAIHSGWRKILKAAENIKQL